MDVETDENLSLNSAVQMLLAQFKQTNAKIDNLNGKLDDVKSELATVSNDVQTLKVECAERFRVTDHALHSVNKKVDHLQHAVANVANRGELTIQGIPYAVGENLEAYFKAICRRLAVRESPTHIRRIKPRNQMANNGGLIVVEFSLLNDRNDFYSAYLKNHELKLRDVGLNSDARIYINENLTLTARKLKVLALNLKRSGKLSSVFTKQGIVHVKRTSDDPPVPIHEEGDLTVF